MTQKGIVSNWLPLVTYPTKFSKQTLIVPAKNTSGVVKTVEAKHGHHGTCNLSRFQGVLTSACLLGPGSHGASLSTRSPLY